MAVVSPIPASLVALATAPPISAYPQFLDTAIPLDSGAIRAYRGYIRPFSDDATARRVLRALVAELPLQIFEGRLDSDVFNLPEHPLERFLLGMAEPCTIVVLEFADKRHPRVYLVDPLPDSRASNNHHTWWNRTILIDGKLTPQLCIYSANQFSYDPSLDRLPQFFDQVSTYLAKHLIFLRTRMLHMLQKDGTLRRVSDRKPWQSINHNQLKYSKKLYFYGTWVGPIAPHGSAEHLTVDDPNRECYCNSGELYGDCHLKFDQRVVGLQNGEIQ